MTVSKLSLPTIRLPIRALLIAMGALVIMLALALAAPLFVSADSLRRAVAVEVAGLTGQQVSISGAARFSSLPWPTVIVEKIQIGSDEPGDAPVVEAAGLEARLGLIPLIGGRVEVRGLILDRPRIVLRVDGEGRSNWRSSRSSLSLLAGQAGSDRPFRLGDLAIRAGTISYRDDQARRRGELSNVDIAVSWPSASARLTTFGNFRFLGEEFRFQGALDRPAAFFARDISPIDLAIDTPALRAQIGGNALAATDIQIEGRLTFSSPSFRRLAAWLVPEARGAPDVGPVEGTARLKILDRSVALEDARLMVDRARGEGALSLTFDRTRTRVQGTMDFDTVDIRPFLDTQLARVGDPAYSADPIARDSIGPIDLDFLLSVDTLMVGRTTIRTAALSLLTREGRVEATLGDGQAFGGRLSARLVAEARSEGGVRTRAQFSASDIRVDNALRELFGVIRLGGTGGANLTLSGEGASVREIAANMRGEVALRLAQGTLTGLDLATLIRRAERNPVEALIDARGGRTTIEQASATFRLAGLEAVSDDVVIRGPGYRVTMRGTVAGATRSLAFTGALASTAPSDPRRASAELPFVIRGPWADPVFVPNPDALIRRRPEGEAAPQ